MADGRMVNKSVGTDERLNGLSGDAMLLYLMAIPHLDRDGLIDGRPRVLWATVAPLQDRWMPRCGDLIDEWVGSGLVVRYEDDRQPVLFFPGFGKNQARMVYHRERESRFCCPPGYERARTGLRPIGEDAGARDEVMQNARLSRAHGHTDSAGARDEVMPEVQDQDQTEVEVQHDVDVVFPSHQALPCRGGSQEGGGGSPDDAPASGALPAANGVAPPPNGTGSAGDILYAYTDQQLRLAAFELGAELGLPNEWTGYERYLSGRSPGELAVLLEWIGWYRAMPDEALEKIKSLTALIRSNINKGIRAPLTGAQRRGLAEAIAHAVAVVEPYDP